MIPILIFRDRVHKFCSPGIFLTFRATIYRWSPALDGVLIPLLFPPPTVVSDRSLESGILPNDVSPVIPLSETLGVLFRFLVCRCRPQVGGGVGRPNHRADQTSQRSRSIQHSPDVTCTTGAGLG